MKKLPNIFLTQRFYTAVFSLSFLLILGHFFAPVFVLAKILLFLFIALLLIDTFLLLQGKLQGSRQVAERFSNGDPNPVNYSWVNLYPTSMHITLRDEFPEQFQLRKALFSSSLQAGKDASFTYQAKPLNRGVYSFGRMHLIARSTLGLLARKFSENNACDVAVYPSFLQLKKYELQAFSFTQQQAQRQKFQRPGNSKEFEQIKEYVVGDDYRKLNWKATARMSKLMVNEYQEEQSRHIYQLIDMGRTMQMPFEGMTLLDYAINASLALANIVLKKHDKTGLLTYSTKVHAFVKSDQRQLQLKRILETLYAQKTLYQESNLEQVYALLEKNMQGRSLLLFYTNFESEPSLERQLPLLQKMARKHLVMLVTFVNTELEKITHTPAQNTEEVYQKALAQDHIIQKAILMEQLKQHGILHIKVRPDELSAAVIQKYLEIKDRGLI